MKGEHSYIREFDPMIGYEDNRGINYISLMTKHFENRKLFLVGEVNDKMAEDFVVKFLWLSQTNEPIDIYIDSPGGSVAAGLIIYDVLQACAGKIPVNIYCIGLAASMGAVILASGQKGRRYVMPHAKCMIHEPLIAGNMGGSATDIAKTAESILGTKKQINELLAKHTGKTLKAINKATSYDNFMDAEEAVKFGLCDEIKDIF